MRVPRWLPVLAAVVASLGPSVGFAGTSEPDESDGSFSRTVDRPGNTQPGDDGDTDGDSGDTTQPVPPPKIPCRWTPVPTTAEQVDGLNLVLDILANLPFIAGNSTLFDIEYYEIDLTLQRWGDAAARFERLERADCSSATQLTADEIRGWRWQVVIPPQAAILIPDLLLVVSGRIRLPEPEINPPFEAPVNLGLWLAVADNGPIVAQGALGPLWARGTATLTSTTFDPGNGARPIVCPGAGTPLVDEDIVVQGPCGYTYRSLNDVRDDDLAITVTSEWTVTWETSDGSGAGVPPQIIRRTTIVPYEVYEIQTVGTGG